MFYESESIGTTPNFRQQLFRLVEEGSPQEISDLLNGLVGELLNKGNILPLRVAATLGRTDIMELLLKRGADPNGISKDRSEQPSPIHCAAGMGHVEAIELLIKWGALIERAPSVLGIAGECGQLEVIKYFRDNLSIDNRNYREALTCACERSSSDFDTRNNWASMSTTTAKKQLAVIKYLVGHCDLDLNKADATGSTPFCFFLERCLDVYTWPEGSGPYFFGSGPLDWLVRDKKAFYQVVTLFVDKGAPIDRPNKYGNTPLDLARELERFHRREGYEHLQGLSSFIKDRHARK